MKAARPTSLPLALPLALAASLTLAACASSPEAPRTAPAVPAPRPSPIQTRPAPATSPAPQPNTSWIDAALTPGAWRYHQHEGGTSAYFIATTGAGGFVMTCNVQSHRIELWREGDSRARVMTIRTETAARTLAVVPVEETLPYHAADVAPGDPLLDAMALSKGRFAVEVEGEVPLILPSYAEVSRVIEDCR